MSLTRLRSQGGLSSQVMAYQIVPVGPSAIAPYSGTIDSGSFAGSWSQIQDVTKSGFHKTRDFSKWVNNPLTIIKVTATVAASSATTSCVLDDVGNGLVRTWTGDLLGTIFGPLVPMANAASFGTYADLIDVGNLTKLATMDCWTRISPVKSQSLIIAAEARKTVDMILDRSRKLAAFYQAARKGRRDMIENILGIKRPKRVKSWYTVWDNEGNPILRRGGKQTVKFAPSYTRVVATDTLTDLARLELEYRYGWTPFVHDIVDSLKAINAEVLRGELQQRVFETAYGRRDATLEQTTPLSVGNLHGGAWTGTKTLTHKVNVKAYAKYRYLETSGLAARMQEFGIFDVPRTAWDLVPLSFVSDWVIPVGQWLEAITPKVGVEVIESGVVLHASKVCVRKVTGYSPIPATGVGSWPQPPVPLGTSDSFQTELKQRTVGLPSLTFPPTEVRINFKRIVDAVALLKVLR